MATQLPGKLFTDFEAWDPRNSQRIRPEIRGPKYCSSSFDAITVGKMVPAMPGVFFPSSTSLGVPELNYIVWGMEVSRI